MCRVHGSFGGCSHYTFGSLVGRNRNAFNDDDDDRNDNYDWIFCNDYIYIYIAADCNDYIYIITNNYNHNSCSTNWIDWIYWSNWFNRSNW